MTTAKMRVSYQGEPGANSHMASMEVFPASEAVPGANF